VRRVENKKAEFTGCRPEKPGISTSPREFMTLGYPGTTVRTSTPSDFKAIGRAPVTSASSPILIKGYISEATESTRRDFIIQPVDHRLR
jgi:hypothetical protein